MKKTWNMTDSERLAYFTEQKRKRDAEPKPPVPPHQITLEADDEGIHVCCSCQWFATLGYSPSPEAAWQAAAGHLAEAGHRENVTRMEYDTPAVTDANPSEYLRRPLPRKGQ